MPCTADLRPLLLASATLLACAACSQEMEDQARHEPLEASAWFADGASARPPIPGTVAHGELPEPPGSSGSPARPSAAELEQGRRDYAIYCTPCHGRLGEGDGMAVRRGFPRPAPFTEARLRAASDAALAGAVAHGKQAMPGYAARLDARAIWRVVQWVRVLQLSGHAPLAALAAEDRQALAALEQEGSK